MNLLPNLLITLGTLAPQGVEERAAVRDLAKVFPAGRSVAIEPGRTALEAIAAFDSTVVAEALVSAFGVVELETAVLEGQRADVNAKIAELIRGQAAQDARELAEPQFSQWKNLQARSVELRSRVDDLRELADVVRGRVAALTDAGALDYLLRKVIGNRKQPLPVKLAAARAIGAAESADRLADVVRAVKRSRQPEERVALLDAIALQGEAARAWAGEVIDLLDDREQPVRERAALALAKIAVPQAIGPMIDLLARETGQTRKRVAAALEVLTRQQHGDNLGAWQAWWKVEQEDFLAGRHPLGGGIPSHREETNRNYYFGIPQDGGSIVYMLDCSGSMREQVDFTFPDATERGSSTRLEACKSELIRALGRLRPDQEFNVVWYNDLAYLYRDTMQRATPAAVRDAQHWVQELAPGNTTNIHDALRMAFSLTGRGASDRYYGVAVDTIFLLTDGTPTLPDGSPDSTEKILSAVADWNPLGRVVIHTIGIGERLNEVFLRQLASDNGGRFGKH